MRLAVAVVGAAAAAAAAAMCWLRGGMHTFRVPRFFFFPSKSTLTHAAHCYCCAFAVVAGCFFLSLTSNFNGSFYFATSVCDCVYICCYGARWYELVRYSHTIYTKQKRTLSVHLY